MNAVLHKLSPIGAATVLFVAMTTTAFADQIVRIGHFAPLTGMSAHVGKDDQNGARLAIEEINAKQLVIGGQKVTLELDGQDDAADPKTGTVVAQKMVDDGVVAVIGSDMSSTTIPAARIFSDAGIVQISPGATNPDYTLLGYKTAFRVVGTDAQQGPALADYGVKVLKAKTVAIVDDSTSYGQGLASQFEKGVKAQGATVLSHDATNDKAVDFRSILTRIKGENPDVIMYGGEDATGGPFAKQAAQLGIRARILAGDGVCTESLAELAGTATDNIVCSEAGMALSKMPGGAVFVEKYKKRFQQPIQIYAPYSYDAVYIIVDAMKRANSTNPAKILAEMPSTNYKGVIGDTTFDSKGDLQHGVISVFYYKKGEKTLIDVMKM
ncbi:branched-chain amino acid ABC transporter substrate-binding protein [Paraburkholderia caballeronis]|uniref:branched-chain amino acid ABC transporter substrate-binding protein n=1 Tax=Paraburkholderia caballeronis TaxID=416943 RepID=UPI001066EBA9|nr:branched-chain amino acid ABC transporter substrate-binding protein [Paraburkholderia caballeronis]TDV16329.1 L-leucine-binding protein [Paraburkholderia caballeronis]TDV20679.1 L-leucine-binding protein [Paraburkholderia caballeronis]TDV33147.1 L-leucine-binding protein [Paraburkholderia caballeronis]